MQGRRDGAGRGDEADLADPLHAVGRVGLRGLDEDHLVADLYNMVNVPSVVWIDEEGRTVGLNPILDWFREDFDDDPLGLVLRDVRGAALPLDGDDDVVQEGDDPARAVELAAEYCAERGGDEEVEEAASATVGEAGCALRGGGVRAHG